MATRPQQPNEVDKADVLKLLQSTLISSKGGVPLDKINREYRNLVGENIPFRNFGYNDLQEFLNDAKNVCKVNYGPDGPIVRGVSSEETAHIQDMVKKQKQTKKPKPKPPRRPLNAQQHWQPPTPADYPTTHGSSGFRHGFRPPTQQQNGFRPMMMNNRNSDQRNMSGGGSGGRFMNGGGRGSRLLGGGGNFPNGSQQMNHRLRAPQNGPHMAGGPPPRNSQQQQQSQQNPRPMSQRLGPPNGHGPPNTSRSSPNYIKMLENYFAQMGLGAPEFKTSKMEKKQSNSGGGKSSKKVSAITKYYSTVRVNKESFQTYPTEYNTEKEAEEAAAKLACEKLNIGNQFSFPPSASAQSPGTASKDISPDILIDRIVELVGQRTNGVWSSSIEKEYSDKYGQALPDHWTERIETYQTRPTVKKRIQIERPIQDRCIVMPFIDQSSNSDATSPKSPVSPGVAQASLVAKSVSPNYSLTPNVMQRPRGPAPIVTGPAAGVASQVKLPELILPGDKVMWDVYVTHIFSTVEVCVRLLGEEYSTKFEDLITEMELHYYDVDKIPHVTKPVIGRIYAAMVEGEWHRVEAVSLKGIDVTCYFIDHGGEHDVLNINLLREIEPKFLTLAPQAKRVRLAGLEEYALSPIAHAELTTAALARSLVGQVHSRVSDQDISLILFDTSGEEEDININQMLLEKLKLMPEAAVPAPVKNGASPSSVPPTGNNDVISPSTSPSESQELDLMSLDLASLKPLIHAVIPEEGQYFDVNVTLAASPSNFTVQPYQESSELERLMSSMKDFYSNPAKHYPLKLEDLSKDMYFAALHSDEQWYRVKINSQLDSCTMAVKIVDFGDYSMVPLENLQPLWPQFRNLPIQAINATLAGIVAIEGDWTVDDTVWFARRVVNSAFVSIIKDISYDELEDSYKIGVSLIDTTNPAADIYIEKELVDSERAAFLCI